MGSRLAGGLLALLRCGGVLGGRLWKVAESTQLYFLIYVVEKTVSERFGSFQKHRAGHTNLFRRSFGPSRSSFRPSHSSFSPNRSRCSRSRSRSRRSRSSFRPSHSSFTKEASRHSINEVINWEASRRGAGGLSALFPFTALNKK